MAEAELHRNVQFIYERALALLELEAFGGREVTDRPNLPKVFHFNSLGRFDDILKKAAYFARFNDDRTVYGELIRPGYQGGSFNITRSVNTYLTHWFYPYKGKFHPQMIRGIFNILKLGSASVILDPFSGSGTTGLEAMVFGATAIGVDTSPLCILQGKVKTQAWKEHEKIASMAQKILSQGSWSTMKEALDPARRHRNRVIREFFELAWMIVLSDIDVRNRAPESSLARNLPKMVRSIQAMNQAKETFGLEFGDVDFRRGDVRDLATAKIEGESIDAVITSPPYSIALDYVKNDRHALEALGEKPEQIREQFVGVRGRGAGRAELYVEDMKAAFSEISRVLKPGGRAVMVIGNATIGAHEIATTKEMITWASAVGLNHYMTSPKIVYGLYSIMLDEDILFFQKE